jgi:hypothetical protein
VSTPMKRCRCGARIDATPGVGGMFNTLKLDEPWTCHTSREPRPDTSVQRIRDRPSPDLRAAHLQCGSPPICVVVHAFPLITNH